jgi:hypothetical protein
MQHLSPEPIQHREADVRTVLGRIDVNPKRALATSASATTDTSASAGTIALKAS